MTKNSIILCTHNEEKYIEETVTNLYKHLNEIEIVIVDDKSSDDTIKKIKKINSNKNIKLIERNDSIGLGSAFLRGLIETSGDNIGWLDTNMGELAEMFPQMISQLKDYEIVILSRYVEGGNDKRDWIRVYCSKIINILCRLILGSKVKDYTSSIFIMKRKVLNEVPIIGYGHGDFFIEFLYCAQKKNIKIKEIPYTQQKDKDITNSKSASNLFRYFYLGFFYILRVFVIRFRRF